MKNKSPMSTCINRETFVEDVYKLNVTVTDKLHNDMLQHVRSRLNEVLFRSEYKYTRCSDYVDRMCEGIDDNPIIINALDKIKEKDECTFSHSINTAFYSMFIAMCMGLSEGQVNNAIQAGLLHDIGKIYIPGEILNKKGSLVKEEYEIIKKHTLYGYFLLNEFGNFNLEVRRAVLFHHERIGSTGYPLSASLDNVGFISKIVAVADVYDAMTTNRVYKKGVDPDDAINFLCADGMKILDNEVIEIFQANIPIYDFKTKDLLEKK
ncbi:HD-GYP domain-containing protein [Clostridium sp.]